MKEYRGENTAQQLSLVRLGDEPSELDSERDDEPELTVPVQRVTSSTREATVREPEERPTTEMAPMLRQYLELKQQYPEHMLLFQVGDFYEVFFDDAKIVSQALSIRLTSRNKDAANPVSMCGVPIHALDNYLPRLLQHGLSCVLVSQVEEPERSGKGAKAVKREVTRIVTPGVRYAGDGLDEKDFNFLAGALLGSRGEGAVAFVDVSTGHMRLQEVQSGEELLETVERIRPVELILPLTLYGTPVDKSAKWYRELKRFAEERGCHLVMRPFEKSDRSRLTERLGERLTAPEAARKLGIQVEGLSLEALSVLLGTLNYVDEISFGDLPKFSDFRVEGQAKTVFIDAATCRNLELTHARIDGEKRNSLVHHIDYTKTAMGSRLLVSWLLAPSSDLLEITDRHDAVDDLRLKTTVLEGFRTELQGVRDLERIITRITSGRAVPRDLGMLLDSIKPLKKVKELLGGLESKLLQNLNTQFNELSEIRELLERALGEDLPSKFNEGGIFRAGYHQEIDRLKNIRHEGRGFLAALEEKERERTGITSLKVKFNSVFGYFIEVTKTHLAKIPSHFERKQTLVNAERFVTEELKSFELEILSAKARQIELEKELFLELRAQVGAEAARIQATSQQLSVLDVLCAFSHLALQHNFCRPELSSECRLEITSGRHPVVERVIGQYNFVPNDTRMDGTQRRFAVLTGPNMGGKSTYLRQVGLIQLLAQAGSFVPASSAKLGLVDRIFTRIGAADDLTRGDSTFMVEMREAGTILRRATQRSLVLIDEIGRGTATTDGLAIATAVAEWLHDRIKCLTVFATHFHELTGLPQDKAGAFCLSVGVVEKAKEIIFTHRIEERAASRSYGIEVARLAGLPEELLGRAEDVLRELAGITLGMPHVPVPEVLSTEIHAKAAKEDPVQDSRLSELLEKITNCDLDKMTPLEALLELNELKELSRLR